MNRAQRRAYNKANKTSYTKEQFDIAYALSRLQNGEFDMDDLAKARQYVHIDNTELVPDGTVVKLNYNEIYSRPTDMLTDEFKAWVEENKDKEFHVTREGTSNSLVALEEDKRTTELDGKIVEAPRWLFDLYSDLLVKTDEGFKPPYAIDAEMKDYVPADDVQRAMSQKEGE